MPILKAKYKHGKKKIYCMGIPIYKEKYVNPLFYMQQQISQLEKAQRIDFSQCNISLNTNIDRLLEQIDYLRYIVLPALQLHPKVFEKYKNTYRGKDVVLVATGPTLKNYFPIKDAIHVGVNSAFSYEKVKLDYLFIQDRYPTIYSKSREIAQYPCHKFFGMHYIQHPSEESIYISQDDVEANNAERYYFLGEVPHPKNLHLFSADITTRPLLTWGSTSFCALDFILWTHPKCVYLIGCDNTGYVHFDDFTDSYQRGLAERDVINCIGSGWHIFKQYASIHYPETKIISVNPIGLKGMFHDVYTESYLAEHPEIARENPEILKEEIL